MFWCPSVIGQARAARAGDAHYKYRGVRDFPGRPAIECYNRRELAAWLDGIVRDSQGTSSEPAHAGASAAAAPPLQPQPLPPVMPLFVAYRCAPCLVPLSESCTS